MSSVPRVDVGDAARKVLLVMHSAFESREDMEKWVSMGTVEGLQQAVGRMHALLE